MIKVLSSMTLDEIMSIEKFIYITKSGNDYEFSDREFIEFIHIALDDGLDRYEVWFNDDDMSLTYSALESGVSILFFDLIIDQLKDCAMEYHQDFA